MTIEEVLQSLRDCDYAECKEWADAIEAAMEASDREYLDLMDRRDEAALQAAHLRIVNREQKAEIERLKADFEEACEDRANTYAKLVGAQAEIERLKKDLAVYRDRSIKLDLDLDDCSAEDERLQTQLDGKDAEIERLYTALRHISLASQNSMSSKEECGRIARAALAGKEESK